METIKNHYFKTPFGSEGLPLPDPAKGPYRFVDCDMHPAVYALLVAEYADSRYPGTFIGYDTVACGRARLYGCVTLAVRGMCHEYDSCVGCPVDSELQIKVGAQCHASETTVLVQYLRTILEQCVAYQRSIESELESLERNELCN